MALGMESTSPVLFRSIPRDAQCQSLELGYLQNHVLAMILNLLPWSIISHMFIRTGNEHQGRYGLRLYLASRWQVVYVDDRFPIVTLSGSPLSLSSVHQNEIWILVLEKALAKVFGSYESVCHLSFSQLAYVFTGGFVTTINEPRAIQDWSPSSGEILGLALDSGVILGVTCQNPGHWVLSRPTRDPLTPGLISTLQLLGSSPGSNRSIEIRPGEEGPHEMIKLESLRCALVLHPILNSSSSSVSSSWTCHSQMRGHTGLTWTLNVRDIQSMLVFMVSTTSSSSEDRHNDLFDKLMVLELRGPHGQEIGRTTVGQSIVQTLVVAPGLEPGVYSLRLESESVNPDDLVMRLWTTQSKGSSSSISLSSDESKHEAIFVSSLESGPETRRPIQLQSSMDLNATTESSCSPAHEAQILGLYRTIESLACDMSHLMRTKNQLQDRLVV